jgi:O-antigen/teichoic acid export membrane protein
MSDVDIPAPSEPPSGKPAPGDVTRTQVRSSTVLLAGQAFAVAVNLVTQILLVRYLSKTSFGTFAFALSIVALAETVAAFGLRRGVNRFVPIYEERRELQKAAGALVFAFGTVLGLGLAVVLVVMGLRSAITGELASSGEASAVLTILIVLALVHALEALLDGTFAVFVRPRVIFFRRFVYTPVTRLLVVILLIAAGSGTEFLAAGYVAVGVLGLIVYSALLVPVLREHELLELIRERRLDYPVRELLSFTTPLLTNDIAGAMIASAGAVLLGIWAGVDEVAALRAVLPISLTLTYVLTAFGTLFVPLAARLHTRGRHDEINRLYWQTAAWTAVFSFPVFALAFAFGEQLVTLLFGERYASSGAILAALTLGHFFTAATGPNGQLLSVYGQVRYIVWTNLFAVVVNLVIVFALIAALGALGAAIAASTTLIVVNCVRQVGLARRTSVLAVDPRYAPIYAVLVLATAALVAVDLVLAPPFAPALLLVGVASVAVLLFARTRLGVAETFPELARIPGLRRLLFPAGSRP